MFVTEKSYIELKSLDADTKKMIAKITNSIIDREGQVLYGVVYADGSYANFSTTKDKNDTHVVIAIAADIMGLLEPAVSDVRQTKIDEQDQKTIQQKQILSLEQELKQQRDLNKRIAKAQAPGGHQV